MRTNPIFREVVQPGISLAFKYLKYVFLEILIVLCPRAEEVGADCLMRFIFLWFDAGIDIRRHSRR